MTISVFFLTGAAACLLLAGMHAVTFTEPISIRGDHLNLLVTVKDVLQGGGGRLVQALGFPGVQTIFISRCSMAATSAFSGC